VDLKDEADEAAVAPTTIARASSTETRGDEELRAARESFERRYPAFVRTSSLDELRATDYKRLDESSCTYLDYTGSGLYGASQLRHHHEILESTVFGNPHSQSSVSVASTRFVQEARDATRRFFNAAEDEYEVVFTANATGGLKLIGEAYPFDPRSRLLLSYDNHNSVNGIREFARRGGAFVDYVPVCRSDLRLDARLLRRALEVPAAGPHRLFAYPAQSNFSGVKHPLTWVAEAQELGWDVLLDCAAFAPTSGLDLRAVRPDYVVVSFYKLFGYPTGVGALIARRRALAKLRRPWFAGGTVAFASVQAHGGHRLLPGASGFEDGTPDFLALPAVTIGLDHLEAIGMEVIHTRVQALAAWLLEEMARLRHCDGTPLVRVFGPADTRERGATIALQVLAPGGRPYDVYEVERAASEAGIATRAGCFCNPGDGEIAHDISGEDMERCFHGAHVPTSLQECQRVIADATGKVPNTLRVSLGLVSDFGDVHRFMAFLRRYVDVSCEAAEAAPRW